MARIRTIKPEFWTDDVLVQLPFQARLLFIGIWNFADDHGALEENADRLRMQIFPAEPSLDASELIDLLVAANLLERFVDDEGKRVVQVRNWHKHQKVDNPAKSRILSEKYRKLAIPSEARRAVAMKYGCSPGASKDVGCYFCGLPGKIHWWKRSDGKPSAWVIFDLELDHLHPEAAGGANSAENLVLSCRSCNRGRRNELALPWILSRTLAKPIEASPSEGKGKGREKEKEKEGTSLRERPPNTESRPEPEERQAVERLKSAYPQGIYARSDWLVAEREARRRVDEGHTWDELIAGCQRYAAQCQARGNTGTQYVESPKKFFTLPECKFQEAFPLPIAQSKPDAAPKLTWRPPPDEESTCASA